MPVSRGDVVIAWFPFVKGGGGKSRPALVVQNDNDNARLTNTVLVQISSNLRAAHEPTHLLIEADSELGRAAGLLQDSVVSCNNFTTISNDEIDRVIGHLDITTMQQIDVCLKAALQLR